MLNHITTIPQKTGYSVRTFINSYFSLTAKKNRFGNAYVKNEIINYSRNGNDITIEVKLNLPSSIYKQSFNMEHRYIESLLRFSLKALHEKQGYFFNPIFFVEESSKIRNENKKHIGSVYQIRTWLAFPRKKREIMNTEEGIKFLNKHMIEPIDKFSHLFESYVWKNYRTSGSDYSYTSDKKETEGLGVLTSITSDKHKELISLYKKVAKETIYINKQSTR